MRAPAQRKLLAGQDSDPGRKLVRITILTYDIFLQDAVQERGPP
jgi:hypothetical protein